MSKKTIWFLITLMAIALTGISAFQVYWINSVIELSNERFEKDALASLHTVAERLERNEMVDVAANSFAFFGTTEHIDSGDISVDTELMVATMEDSVEEKIFYRTNSNTKVKIVLKQESSEEVHEFVTDTSLTTIDVQVVSEGDHDGVEVAKRLNTKQQVFTRVVEEMMFHESRKPIRVHPVIIDSLLSHELHSRGIHIKFEFGVYDTNQSDFRIIRASNRQELENSPIKAGLFPNDILSNGLSLMVSFPNQNLYLLEKIWTSLLISLVFILMIIGIFAYVVYRIIHQKKLGDLKNDFINNMTHEFKTPIATVSLATEALQEPEVQDSSKLRNRYIEVIKEESRRLGSQVEKVLQLASIEKENLTLNKKRTSLNLLVEAAVDRARFQVEERGGKIEAKLPANEIMINADESHLSNAIFNLLDNAIKYSKNEPEIEVDLGQLKAETFLSVKDHGIGLSKEQQNQVFDKFYRVPTGNLHDVKGFGLGLNYVRFIVEAHGGKIGLISQLGKGSTFKILFPVNV